MENRLASLALDTEDVEKNLQEALEKQKVVGLSGLSNPVKGMAESSEGVEKQATPFGGDAMPIINALPVLFNTLFVRRAIIPAANGHFSARALARYYATLATGGIVPPTTSNDPPLGSHLQRPMEKQKFDLLAKNTRRGTKKPALETKIGTDLEAPQYSTPSTSGKIYSSFNILDAFLGSGEYSSLAFAAEKFGLGFRRITAALADGVSNSSEEIIGFGHSGVGGSTGFCYPAHNFSLAITVNKLSQGAVTAKIARLVVTELGLPCPAMYASVNADRGPDMTGGASVEA